MRTTLTLLFIALAWAPFGAQAEYELTPFAGFRAGGDIDVETRDNDSRSELEFDDGESFGLLFNIDLAEAGKQAELYFARQDSRVSSSEALFAPAASSVELVIYQLQFGGLYFPGGQTTGGFVSGVAGVTRLEPEPSGFKDHHRASISLGAGYKMPLHRNLLLRLDLRGVYTVLDSGGSAFCSGGCNLRFESNGYLQFEAGVGLAVRF
ncbi:hypothetical protein [Marinobacter salicampi]|uniref:hypothetical protein n=1 Tax=Marinobacter salicampi TaxID=435907 RepID=UPI00140C8BFA|nr:hypothetical protein [Marinobacter salicampi]